MQILKIFPNSINQKFLESAAETMRQGGIIIYPTDTLYALGCDALNQRAIERLCRIKGINPDKNLLSVVCSDISQAAEYARIDNMAFRTLKNYLPGPFTFILPASTRLPKIFKGRKTVGIRIPDHAVARQLASSLGNPVLTTSVDIDDEDELRHAESVAMHYADMADMTIDGGRCSTEPSTIVDLTDSAEPVIIRNGIKEFEG